MPAAGFEPAIPAGERLQTRALDRSATGIGFLLVIVLSYSDWAKNIDTICKVAFTQNEYYS